MTSQSEQIDAIQSAASPIDEHPTMLEPVMNLIGDASIVLLGEATHGTDEFYHLRTVITRRLIEERGFDAVAVEADWPDAYRVNRFVRGGGDDREPVAALGDFRRFPQWMWRNARVVELIDALAAINAGRSRSQRVGFYGLDLYSLNRSVEAVVAYLDDVDPEAADRARRRYGCFDHGLEDPQQYGYQAALGLRRDCEDEAVAQLTELRHKAGEYLRDDGLLAEDEQFFAEQNAEVVRNAETYYRQMFTRRANTWNLRDAHMSQTLADLRQHLIGQGRAGRIVVWAHNSHLGDARATSMGDRGELNLGQLARQRFGDTVRGIGFSTYQGTVSAASDWDQPVEFKTVRPGIEGGVEALMHEAAQGDVFLPLQDRMVALELHQPMYQRAIGVIYRPETELQSHYFAARLPEQFDALIHIDRSHAVEPLDISPLWQPERVPQTFPHAT